MNRIKNIILIFCISIFALHAFAGLEDRAVVINGKPVIVNNHLLVVSSWTPADTTTLSWYDASDASTITSTNGYVSGLDDKSGNGNNATQLTGADQPQTGPHTINGLNTIEFTDDYLDTPAFTNVRALFFVSDIVEGSGIAANVAPVIGEVSNLMDHTFIRANNTNYSISVDGNDGGTGSASVNGGTPTTSGPQIGKNIDLGLTIAEKKTPLVWYAEYDANRDMDYIGRLEGNGTYKLIGALGEVITLDYVPSTATRQKIEGYLAWKWGLEGSLPVGHPYKNERPLK